jgi:hypothetical protein
VLEEDHLVSSVRLALLFEICLQAVAQGQLEVADEEDWHLQVLGGEE